MNNTRKLSVIVPIAAAFIRNISYNFAKTDVDLKVIQPGLEFSVYALLYIRCDNIDRYDTTKC